MPLPARCHCIRKQRTNDGVHRELFNTTGVVVVLSIKVEPRSL
jgi:hypothetical protein